MIIALLGGTGYVGSHLVDALLHNRHTPRLLVRSGSKNRITRQPPIEQIEGDVADTAALHRLLQGADAVIYNIGLLREFPARGISFEALQFTGVKRVAEIDLSQGVRRFILMSANGVEQSLSAYQRTKLAAEA